MLRRLVLLEEVCKLHNGGSCVLFLFIHLVHADSLLALLCGTGAPLPPNRCTAAGMVTSMSSLNSQIAAMSGPMTTQSAALVDVKLAIAAYPDTLAAKSALTNTGVVFTALPTPRSQVIVGGAASKSFDRAITTARVSFRSAPCHAQR